MARFAIVGRSVIPGMEATFVPKVTLAAVAKSTAEMAFCRLISRGPGSVHGAVVNNPKKDRSHGQNHYSID